MANQELPNNMLETAIDHMFIIAEDRDILVIFTTFTEAPIRVIKSRLNYSFFGECLRMNVRSITKRRKDKKYMIPLESITAIAIDDARRL